MVTEEPAPVIKNFFTSIKYLGEDYNYEFIVKPEYVGVIDPQEEIKVLFQLGFIDSYGTPSGYKQLHSSRMLMVSLEGKMLYILESVHVFRFGGLKKKLKVQISIIKILKLKKMMK